MKEKKISEIIKELEEKENKLRDLYLKKLAKGDLQGPPVGYASIDKPWLKYFEDFAITEDIPKMSINQYIEEKFKDNQDAICLEYYGTKVTRKEFLEKKDKIAKSYMALGVGNNDVVSLISPTTPEVIYSIYALNKLGAKANVIDPRLSIENIEEKCKTSKVVTSIDLAKKKVDKALANNQQAVYFSVSESFKEPLKTIYNVKESFKNKKDNDPNDNSLNWSEFLKISKNIEEIITPTFEEGKVAIIESTSGTTGPSKLAQLTNENLNAVAWQYENSGMTYKVGDTFLNIMPAFLSYGVVVGIHMPLALGFKNVVIPSRDLNKMGEYVLKYKPCAYSDIPNGYVALKNDPKITKNYTKKLNILGKEYTISINKKADLSFLINPAVGGDHFNTQLEEEMTEFLKDHGNNNPIVKGYGMTELASAAVTNVSTLCNSLGSVGVPFVKNSVKVVNEESKKEVGYNEEGELYISSPSLFKGYLNNQDATEGEIEVDETGRKWIHTGDIFSINENGELFFHGRKKAMFVRPDGHNNHPLEMNELIVKHPAVKDACTVGIDSPYHMQGKYPKSVIVLKDEYKGHEEEIQKELENMCMSEFSQRDVPYFYEFKEYLPYTPGGKVDYVALTNEQIGLSNPAEIAREELGNLSRKETKKLVKKR